MTTRTSSFMSFLTSFLQVLNKFYFFALVFLKCTVSLLFLFSILVNCRQHIRVKSFWGRGYTMTWSNYNYNCTSTWKIFFHQTRFSTISQRFQLKNGLLMLSIRNKQLLSRTSQAKVFTNQSSGPREETGKSETKENGQRFF